MTLQVGLVGSDGIVLASDRLVNTVEAGDVSPRQSSKFFHNDRVVCCWSGNRAAEYAANFIQDSAWDNPSRRDAELKECGNRGWRTEYGHADPQPRSSISAVRRILAAFPQDCTLWDMDVYNYSLTEQVRDKTFSGDVHTTTRHLLRHYIPEGLPVARLIRIAAHMILMGHRENNFGIGGLEIAIVRQGQAPHFLSREQERELTRLSDSMHESISEILLQPFEFSSP